MSSPFTLDFDDRHVLVTGGTSGIGLAVAGAFADAGATVTVTGRRSSWSDYDSGAELERFGYHRLETRDGAGIDGLAAGVDRLDVLVNNAGANFPDGLDESTPEGFEASVELNLFGAHRLARRCHPLLAASPHDGGGNVINLASMSAFRPVALVPGYGAAKAAIVQMTRQLGLTWAPNGVRVNAVAPGLIATNMTAPMKGIAELEDAELAKVPMQRWGVPDDLVGTFLFLASPLARFITGQTLCVDGGYSLT